MPDLLAGTTIQAQDTPVTEIAENFTDENNISSVDFIAGVSICSTTFTAPTTGRVLVHVYMASNGDGTDQAVLSFEIYEGTDETGTLKQSASDNNGLRTPNEVEIHRSGATALVTGLTPGVTHFIRTMHKVTGGAGIDIFHRRAIVVPTP